ncbi:MAG: hypothetical protein ABSB67_04950 [Bryobacteraceae bacterium]|jgi:hypothetical protein
MRRSFWRKTGRTGKYLLFGLAILYVSDLAVFQVRLMLGSGMGSVTVDSFLKTPLKGEKVEFDYLGTANESCSQTLFPQYAASAWNPPCWWLAHHKTRWQ